MEKLDKIFAAIDKAKRNIEKNLDNVKELFQSTLNHLFTHTVMNWPRKPLGKVCTNMDSQRIPVTKCRRKKGKYPYYGASGVVDYVDDYIFDGEFLLVSEDGGNLAMRTYPIAFSISGKNWVNNHAHVLKFDNLYFQKIVEYYINWLDISHVITGTAQPKLNQKALNNIMIPCPITDIQATQVVSQLDTLKDSVAKAQASYEQKLKDLEELKQAVLQQAFNGKL